MIPAAFSLLIGLHFAGPSIYYSSDLWRFPTEDQARASYNRARTFLQEVEAEPPLWAYRMDGWYALQRECATRVRIWERLLWAHESWDGAYRQFYLNELRLLIGDEAYIYGWMPPPVP